MHNAIDAFISIRIWMAISYPCGKPCMVQKAYLGIWSVYSKKKKRCKLPVHSDVMQLLCWSTWFLLGQIKQDKFFFVHQPAWLNIDAFRAISVYSQVTQLHLEVCKQATPVVPANVSAVSVRLITSCNLFVPHNAVPTADEACCLIAKRLMYLSITKTVGVEKWKRGFLLCPI